jgi:hypothetical protein
VGFSSDANGVNDENSAGRAGEDNGENSGNSARASVSMNNASFLSQAVEVGKALARTRGVSLSEVPTSN